MWWDFFQTPVSIDQAGGALDDRRSAALKRRHPERMSKEEFILEVRKTVSVEDFKRYESNLDEIEPRDYSLFIMLMLFGLPMGLNPAVLGQIKEIREETGLMDREILTILPKYALIIMMLEGR